MGGKVEINGIDITYKEAGSGSDIIMIHGIFASKEIMNPLFDYCKNDYHVISYDLRGHGESGKTENFTIDDHAHDLKAIIDHFELERPMVIGLSRGSFVTLRTSELYPDLLSKMVLIGVKGRGSISMMQETIDKNGGKVEFNLKDVGRAIFSKVYPPNTTPEMIEKYYKGNRGRHQLTSNERKNIYLSLSNYDMMDDIALVRIPALLLVGEFDGLNPPSESKKVADALKDAQMEIISGAGHIIFFEKREEVIGLIDSFLNQSV